MIYAERTEDWLMIAQIKNYYSRNLSKGKAEWEMIANDAMERRKRGEDLGPPPTVSAVTRKRVETPQPVSHRPLAPSVEAVDSMGLSPKPHVVLPVQASPPQHQPKYSTLAQAASPQAQLQNSHASTGISPQGSISGDSQQHRQLLQQQLQAQAQVQRGHEQVPGPRAGYFTDGSRLPIQPQPDAVSMAPHQIPQQHRSHASQPQQAHSPQQRNVTHHRGSSIPSNLTASYKPLPVASQKPLYADEALYRERPISRASRADAPDSIQMDSRQGPIHQRGMHQQPYQPPPASHRSVGDVKDQTVYSRPSSQSQPLTRPLAVNTLVREEGRPGSAQISPIAPPPQPSRPPEVKKSSIMSLLNSDPEEPFPRRSLGEHVSSIPTPPPRSPQPPMYPTQQRSSQEMPPDQRYGSQSQQPGSYRPSYGSSGQQPARTPSEMIAGSSAASSSHQGSYSRPQYVPQSHSPPAQTPYPQPHSYRSSNNSTPPAMLQQTYGGQRRSSFSDRGTPIPPRQANPQSAHIPSSSQPPSLHDQRYFQHGQHQQSSSSIRQMAPQSSSQIMQDPRSGYGHQSPQAQQQQQQQQGPPPAPYPPHQQPSGQPPPPPPPPSLVHARLTLSSSLPTRQL